MATDISNKELNDEQESQEFEDDQNGQEAINDLSFQELYMEAKEEELGFDIYDIGDTDEEDVGFYFDDYSMSRSYSCMDIL